MRFYNRAMGAMLAVSCSTLVSAATPPVSQDLWHAKAEKMLEQSVKIPTVVGKKHVPELAKYFAEKFRSIGISDADIHILPYKDTAALIVRWRAVKPSSQKPIMIMGHMDVVAAEKSDWSLDPFTLTKKDGYYYGRGTLDMKEGLVSITAAIMQLKTQHFQNKRDIILFFTGDEETGGVGAKKGATEWKDLLSAEYGLNADAGGGLFDSKNQPLGFQIQTAEKTYADYRLTVRNPGGHSSKPRADNAIYELSAALKRLEEYRFQPMLTETTRAYFTVRARSTTGHVGNAMQNWLKNPTDIKAADVIEADPGESGLTRTRCVATRLSAGHANNALPQLAQATINCRIMPGVSPDAIQAELQKVVADPSILVERLDKNVASLDSPLRPDVLTAYEQSIHVRFPQVAVMPSMSTGATDARPFRIAGIPVYGVNGAWYVSPADLRAHGRDERFPVQALKDNVDHWVRMLSILAG